MHSVLALKLGVTETSLGYDILSVITRLRADMNISDDWHANQTSSHRGNTSML
jgi:hypothetical protein